jgi:hypothetical protein
MATEVAELLATVDVDYSPADRKLQQFEQRIDQSAQKVATSVNKVGASAVPIRGVTAEFSRLANMIPVIGSPLARLTTQVGGAISIFDRLGTSSEKAAARTAQASSQASNALKSVLSDIAREGAAVDAAVTKAALKVESLTSKLGKAQYAQRASKSDFVQAADQKFASKFGTAGAIDANFLRSVGAAKGDMERLDVIAQRLKTYDATMAGEVERAALAYQKLGRTGRAELSGIKDKLGDAQKNLDSVTTSAGATKAKLSELQASAKGAQGEISNLSGATGTFGGALGTILGVSALVIVAIGAIAIGAAALTYELFSLTNSTTASTAKLYDMSQKTGFTVQTLSALQAVCAESGAKFDSVVASLSIFNKNMEAAAEGSKKMTALFRELKAPLGDNETALRAVFTKLASFNNEQQQSALAARVFGRGGKEILDVLKAMHGNIDQTIARLRDMGALVSGKAAEDARKYQTVLADLTLQFEGVKRELVSQLMPVFKQALTDLSGWFRENKSTVREWGDDAKAVVEDVIAAFRGMAAIKHYIEEPFLEFRAWTHGTSMDDVRRKAAEQKQFSGMDMGPGSGARGKDSGDPYEGYDSQTNKWRTKGFDIDPADLKGGNSKSGESKAVKAARQEIALLQVELQAKKRLFDTDNKDTDYYYESGLKNLDNYVKEKMRIENDAYDAEVSVLEKQRDAAEKEGTGKTREVAVKKANDNIQALWEAHQAKLTEIDRKQYAQQLADAKAAWDAKIGLMQTQASGVEAAASYVAEKGRLSFQSAAEIIYNAQREILDQQKSALEDQMKNFADGTSKKTEIVNQLADLMAQIKNLEAKAEGDSADAEQKDTDRRLANLNTLQSIGNQTIDIERGIRDEQLKLLEQAGVDKGVIWKKQADEAITNEAEDLRRQLDQLTQQRAYTAKYVAVEQGRAEQLAAIDKQIEATKAASYQRQLGIQEEFLQKQRDELKAHVAGIVDSFSNALDTLQKDGWKGFFKSLGADFLTTIKKMEMDLLKSQLYKGLAALKGIKLEDTKGNPTEDDKNKNPIKSIFDDLFGKLKPEDQPRAISEPIITAVDTSSVRIVDAIRSETVMLEQTLAQLRSSSGYSYSDLKAPSSDSASMDSGVAWLNKILGIGNTSSEIKAAGDATSGAIKDAGGNTVSGIQNQGSATQKGLTSISQSLLSGLAGVASMIANSNTRGGFWSGLFAAAATAAIGAAIGSIGSGVGGDGGSKGGSTAGTDGKVTGAFTGGLLHRAFGGMIYGPGSTTSDNILGVDHRGRPTAMVSPGEYVINSLAVQSLGLSNLNYLNMTGKLPRRASGGFVGSDFAPVMATSGSGGSGHSGKGDTVVYLTQEIHTKDAQSFFRSGRQIARGAHKALSEQLGG